MAKAAQPVSAWKAGLLAAESWRKAKWSEISSSQLKKIPANPSWQAEIPSAASLPCETESETVSVAAWNAMQPEAAIRLNDMALKNYGLAEAAILAAAKAKQPGWLNVSSYSKKWRLQAIATERRRKRSAGCVSCNGCGYTKLKRWKRKAKTESVMKENERKYQSSAWRKAASKKTKLWKPKKMKIKLFNIHRKYRKETKKPPYINDNEKK